MSSLDLKVYEIFKSKLGEKEAEIVIEYFEAKAEAKYQKKKRLCQQRKIYRKLKLILLNGWLAFGLCKWQPS